MWGAKVRYVLKQVLSDKSGATAIEYGLIVSLIAVAILSGAELLGSSNAAQIENVAVQWDAAVASQSK
ncbi:Flp family type IVb pilin [Hirschia litorea]|uniref:Flp family type IVb pilin n=1 Tax=Hirschia litorea TaxID=1199156 RepID=A0ABW2IKE1_9PROT